MARACGLGLLLALLLPVVGTSLPGTVVRLNEAVLSYVSEIGKAPLQQALQVTVPYFLDWNGEVRQPTRIQISNVHVPQFNLKFIANLGIRMLVAANFTFKVFRVPEPLELTLPVVLLADANVAQGSIRTPVVSISACFPLFNNAAVLEGSASVAPGLLVPVQKHIKAVLRNKLCLSISNLVQGLNVHLGTLIGLNPVGPESQIRYSMINVPSITKDYISLDISAVLFLLGKPIVLPVEASHFVLPAHVGAEGAMATVGLSQDLFDSALLLLQKAGALNLDITGHLKSEDNLLNTSMLGQLIPEVARQFPKPMPVALKVRLGATPVATLHTNNATIQLQPFVEVQAVASNSAFQSLFSFDVVVNLNLQLSMSKVKLQGTTSVLGDIQLTVASSNVGFINANQVRPLMDTLFQKPLLDHLDALLGMGIALPSVVNLHYVNPEVFVYEGYVVISSGLSYQH
ncbi:BPI fold-containing family B member 2 [Callorhinus ursinus]|uniref:BPI fold-containing family B member 2-like n=1 Tax=Callorhinus ursinus TaxID=34884 RepID=A0A3Q7PN74_CALUR|nr:BPI fold-containing family B member 2-like [Callorhinus ursinus]XP_025732058.1 BPI fold-containing family B member 2-like [Callorhinus ursinus]